MYYGRCAAVFLSAASTCQPERRVTTINITIPLNPQAYSPDEVSMFLRHRGIQHLQQKAGFIAPRMSADEPIFFDVAEPYASVAPTVLHRLCSMQPPATSPRIPYLLLAWMLFGSDNPFRVLDHIPEVTLTRWVGFHLLTIACGLRLTASEFRHVLSAAAALAQQPKSGQYWMTSELEDARKIVLAASEIASGTTRYGFGAHANIAKVRFEYLAIHTRLAQQRGDITYPINDRIYRWSKLDDAALFALAMRLMRDLLLPPNRSKPTVDE
jgi:hypothetical protein